MEREKLIRYVHYPLNQEITAIGGHYVVTEEIRHASEGFDILYTLGYGVMDTTCCGMGGCAYATVFGFVRDWKTAKNEDGYFVSLCEPLRDEQLKEQLRKVVNQHATVQQINFL